MFLLLELDRDDHALMLRINDIGSGEYGRDIDEDLQRQGALAPVPASTDPWLFPQTLIELQGSEIVLVR